MQPLGHRDSAGLTFLQRKTLGALVAHPNLDDALREAGVTRSQLSQWLSTNKGFRKAFDNLFSDAVEAGRSILSTLLPRAAITVSEALNADKPIRVDVQCPECEHTFKATIEVPEWRTRMRAAEDILKREGELVEVHRHEGQVTHLTLEQQIALHALKRGVPVPPALREELESLGLLESPSSTPSTPSDRPAAAPLLPSRTDSSDAGGAPRAQDASDGGPPAQESASSQDE